MGDNSFGQCGVGASIASVATPTLVSKHADAATQVACGESHTLVLNQAGRVFACGLGVLGQLGGGQFANAFEFSPVVALDARPVTKIACGQYFSCALTLSGMVYVWGSSTNGLEAIGINYKPRNLPSHSVVSEACPLPLSLTHSGAPQPLSHSQCDDSAAATTTTTTATTTAAATTTGVCTPQLVRVLVGLQVIDVACGANHLVCLERNKSVRVFGVLQAGLLSASQAQSFTPDATTSNRLTLPNALRAIAIAASDNDLLVLACDSERHEQVLLHCNDRQTLVPIKREHSTGQSIVSLVDGGRMVIVGTSTSTSCSSTTSTSTSTSTSTNHHHQANKQQCNLISWPSAMAHQRLVTLDMPQVDQLWHAKQWPLLEQLVSKVFSEPSCLCGSFLSPSNPQSSALFAGIDMADLRSFYNMILDDRTPTSVRVLMERLAITLIETHLAAWPQETQEVLRVWLILLDHPMLVGNPAARLAVNQLASTLRNCGNYARSVLQYWWAHYSPNQFARSVALFNYHLGQELVATQYPGPTVQISIELMREFYDINHHKSLIPYTDFHNPVVNEFLRSGNVLFHDYMAWLENNGAFSYCRYPFILTVCGVSQQDCIVSSRLVC
jgi:alpha-tubulin suppressor-like RCC1 family protein